MNNKQSSKGKKKDPGEIQIYMRSKQDLELKPLGKIKRDQFKSLTDHLEVEFSEHKYYFVNHDTLEFLKAQRVDSELIQLLEKALEGVKTNDGVEIVCSKTSSSPDEIVQQVIGKDALRAVYSGDMEIKEKSKQGLLSIIPDWLLGLGVIGLIGLAFAINTHLGEIILGIVLIMVGIGVIYAVILLIIHLLKWLGGDRNIPDTLILTPEHLYVVRGLSNEAKTNAYEYSDFLKIKTDSIRVKIKSLSEHYAILNSKAVKIKLKRKNIDKADTKFFKHKVLPLNHFIHILTNKGK